jgi:hypothetical protein
MHQGGGKVEKFSVLTPAGREVIDRKSIAPRLGDLSGKTVGEVWNGVFRGDESFPIVRQMLIENFPGIKVIPYTEFPFVPGDDRAASQKKMARDIALLAQAKGCDAVIMGNGA